MIEPVSGTILAFIAKRWYIFAAIGIAVLLGLVLGIKSCLTPKPKIDLESINKINSANERERRQELQKVIEDNQTVVTTVDNRTVIAETNVVERNRLIDEKIKLADKAIAEAKQQGRDVSAEELECLLTGQQCPQ